MYVCVCIYIYMCVCVCIYIYIYYTYSLSSHSLFPTCYSILMCSNKTLRNLYSSHIIKQSWSCRKQTNKTGRKVSGLRQDLTFILSGVHSVFQCILRDLAHVTNCQCLFNADIHILLRYKSGTIKSFVQIQHNSYQSVPQNFHCNILHSILLSF